MAINKITNAERELVSVYGLPDKPGMSTEAIQQRFDGLGNLAIDKVNEVIEVTNQSSADIKDLDTRVDQIANNQIPEEYLYAAVNDYIEKGELPIASKNDLTELDSKLSSDIVEVGSNFVNGKNHFKVNDTSDSGVTCLFKDNGGVQFSGTAITSKYVYLGGVYLENGTYTLSAKGTGLKPAIYIRDINGNQKGVMGVASNSENFEIATTDTYGIWMNISNGTTYSFDGYVQLEKGNVATPFEPYHTEFADKIDTNIKPISSLFEIDVTESNVTYVLTNDVAFFETLEFEGVENVTLDGNGCTLKADMSTLKNVFKFVDCKNITVKNFVYKSENISLTVALYNGCLVFCTNCENGRIYNNICYDSRYLVALKDGNAYFDIYNNNIFVENPRTWESPTCMSGIIVYASHDVNVYGNKMFGNMKDGNLSIFGGGTYNVKVTDNTIVNNHVNNVWDSQGITVDQGPTNIIVSNNYVEGCFYGIDLKAGTEDILCSSNIIVGCKCGIANRQGEADNANATTNTIIKDNVIIFDKLLDLISPYLFGASAFFNIGIMIENRYGCTVTDNNIIYKDETQSVVCGIYLNGATVNTTAYLHDFDISRNTIMLEYGYNANVYYADNRSTCILLSNLPNSIVKDNVMRLTPNNTIALYPIRVGGACYYAKIVGNTIKALHRDIPFISGVGETTPHDFLIVNNMSQRIGDDVPTSTRPTLLQEGLNDDSFIIENNYGFN